MTHYNYFLGPGYSLLTSYTWTDPSSKVRTSSLSTRPGRAPILQPEQSLKGSLNSDMLRSDVEVTGRDDPYHSRGVFGGL